jgi:IS605 OrfB family transposase
MLQTLMVKLDPTPEQHKMLCETMKRFNEACNHIAKTVFALHSANKVEIHKTVYYPVREHFGLSAQLTVRAISKVCEAYKRDKSIKPKFRLDGSIVYDQRILSWKGLEMVSLITLQGRQFIPVRFGEYQKARMDRIRGQADLILVKGVFYLCVVVDASKDTFSLIALEDLERIRKRITVRTNLQRRNQSTWSFNQLRVFMTYKTAIAGVPLVYIGCAYTSQECPICHCVSKSNTVAARNIADRVAVNLPIVARFFAQSQAPSL